MRHRGPRAQRDGSNAHSVLLIVLIGTATMAALFMTWNPSAISITSWLFRKFTCDLDISCLVACEGMVIPGVCKNPELLTLPEDFSAGYDIDCERGSDTDPDHGQQSNDKQAE